MGELGIVKDPPARHEFEHLIELVPEAGRLDESGLGLVAAIDLAIDTVEVAHLVRIQIDADRNPPATAGKDRVDEFILAINSSMV